MVRIIRAFSPETMEARQQMTSSKGSKKNPSTYPPQFLSSKNILKKKKLRSSCCGAMSLWHLCTRTQVWSPAQLGGLKDPLLPQLGLQMQLGSNPWPRNSLCHRAAKKKKKVEINSHTQNQSPLTEDPRYSQRQWRPVETRTCGKWDRPMLQGSLCVMYEEQSGRKRKRHPAK